MFKSVLSVLLISLSASATVTAADLRSDIETILKFKQQFPHFPLRAWDENTLYTAKVNAGCLQEMSSCIPNLTVHLSKFDSPTYNTLELRRTFSYRDDYTDGNVDRTFNHRWRKEGRSTGYDQARYENAIYELARQLRR